MLAGIPFGDINLHLYDTTSFTLIGWWCWGFICFFWSDDGGGGGDDDDDDNDDDDNDDDDGDDGDDDDDDDDDDDGDEDDDDGFFGGNSSDANLAVNISPLGLHGEKKKSTWVGGA